MAVINPLASFTPHNGTFIYQHILTALEMQQMSDNDDYLHNSKLARDGSQAMTGALNMGSKNINSVGTINSVAIQTHGSRHASDGADPIPLSDLILARGIAITGGI